MGELHFGNSTAKQVVFSEFDLLSALALKVKVTSFTELPGADGAVPVAVTIT